MIRLLALVLIAVILCAGCQRVEYPENRGLHLLHKLLVYRFLTPDEWEEMMELLSNE